MLGCIKRTIGQLHQFCSIRTCRGGHAEADAGRDLQLSAARFNRLLHRRQQAVRDAPQGGRRREVFDQYHELVAAQPRRQIDRADAFSKPLCKNAQCEIADGVAMGVIDCLE